MSSRWRFFDFLSNGFKQLFTKPSNGSNSGPNNGESQRPSDWLPKPETSTGAQAAFTALNETAETIEEVGVEETKPDEPGHPPHHPSTHKDKDDGADVQSETKEQLERFDLFIESYSPLLQSIWN